MSSNRIGSRIAPAVAIGMLAASIGAGAQAAVVPGEILLRTGEDYLGQPGIPVTDIDRPFVTGDQVGFAFQVVDATVHVWSGDGSVFDNNQLVEGWQVLGSGYSAVVGVSGPTGYVLAPQISNGGSPLDAVISHLGILAIEGEGEPNDGPGIVATGVAPRMDDNADAYWITGIDVNLDGSSDRQSFYRAAGGDPDAIEELMATGDFVAVPSGPLFIQYPIADNGLLTVYAVSDDGTHRIHRLRLDGPPTTSDNVVWVDGEVIMQEGTPANPVGNGDWGSFGEVAINDDGHVLLSANTTAATTNDEVLVYDGAIAVREGDALDGFTLTSPASVYAVSLNDWNQATFMWAAGGTHSLYFACDAADLSGSSQRVAQAGDGFDADGDGVADTTILAFDTTSADGLSEDYAIYSYVALDTDPIELAMARFEVTCCGNGLPDALEGCDDGNADDTDACLTGCVAASCGDGFVWAGMEECDDGNAFDGDGCLASCLEATCGDGIVWEGTEACDDANDDETDDCLSSCAAASCGDGFVQDGVEECDDGNQNDDDECSNRCTLPAAATTSGDDTAGSEGDATGSDITGAPDDTGTPDGTGGPDDTAGPDGTGTADPTATGGPGSDGSGTDASDTDSAGAAGDDGGCACAAGSDRAPLHLALFGLVLALRRRSTKRRYATHSIVKAVRLE